MTSGQLIKRARQEAGLTQQELAERLGITYVGVSQWERDKRTPKYDTLVRIAEALGISVSHLCGEDEPILPHGVHYKKSPVNTDATDGWRIAPPEFQEIFDKLLKSAERQHNYQLSEETDKLIKIFESLNSKGKEKILELASDFSKIPEYRDQG